MSENTGTGPLPTVGPIGKRDDYNPTNRDLYENAMAQNKAINEVHATVGTVESKIKTVDDKVQTLAITVNSHATVIDALKQIKSVAIWILCFVGAGGVISAANALKIWWNGH